MTENRFDSTSLYDRYRIEIRLRDRIVGGVPKDPALIAMWIKARTGHDPAAMTAEAGAALTEQQIAEAKEAMADQLTEGSWNGFKADPERGLYIEARQIKAGFREMAVMLGITQKKRGSRQVLQHGFEVRGEGKSHDRIYLGRSRPDSTEERPIHVLTAQGPRNALKRVDYCEDVALRFEVWILNTPPQESRHLGEEDLVQMLRLGQNNGFGADRSQGAGKFDVVEFSRI